MAVSATPVVLTAIAAVTERIRLASAVTILSTADPSWSSRTLRPSTLYLVDAPDHCMLRHFH